MNGGFSSTDTISKEWKEGTTALLVEGEGFTYLLSCLLCLSPRFLIPIPLLMNPISSLHFSSLLKRESKGKAFVSVLGLGASGLLSILFVVGGVRERWLCLSHPFFGSVFRKQERSASQAPKIEMIRVEAPRAKVMPIEAPGTEVMHVETPRADMMHFGPLGPR
uniref:Uncharacterized protein n=1 Tax=Cannabis sativa TaxID=3483 RepID=A0A803NFI0_CANSA